jgi:hypothetical protein
MSPIYVPGKVVLRKGWQPMDADAAAYITAVETADGQALEEKVKIAIDNFVLGCKADGIWNAIKASCILAGARTTNGALVSLVGTAPTPFNFDLVGNTDYNRKTGLKGDGSTKYLASNVLRSQNPSASNHLSVHVTQAITHGSGIQQYGYYIGSSDNQSIVSSSILNYVAMSANSSWQNTGALGATGFLGINRDSISTVNSRIRNASQAFLVGVSTGLDRDIRILRGYNNDHWNNGRIAFYSIGESLNLALLDARVTDLINAFAAAIP